MESSSEGEDRNNNNCKNGDINETPDIQCKPKRKMKTPFQLEILEKAYAAEAYPTEAARVELSEKLGLTDRQLQMWFCHRRLKDKKGLAAKKSPLMNVEVGVMDVDRMDVGSEPGSGSGSSHSDSGEPHKVVPRYGRDGAMVGDDGPKMQRRYKSLETIMELRAIAAVEEQLGEPLREDGPILGMEFDPLPPDAFGAPIATMGQLKGSGPYDNKLHEQIGARSNKASMRALHERQYLHDQPGNRFDAYGQHALNQFYDSPIDGPSAKTSSFIKNEQLSMGYGVQGHLTDVRSSSQRHKQGHALSSPVKDKDHLPPRDSYTNIKMEDLSSGHVILGTEHSHVSLDRQSPHKEDVMRMERKRKNDEGRISREVEAHEKRIRKELEKQDILRRKMEEQMRKEMEKQDRERRKEEERLMREKQREEERLMREQRREIERREKFLQKESLKAEKRRQKEELRREREAVRQKAAIERASARKIARESMELIEDERLELMELAASSKGLPLITSLDHDTLKNIDSFRDSLGTFPPMSVHLKRPFAIQPWKNSDANIGNLLMVWRFLINFADVLELWPFTLDEFVQAFHDYDSRLLGEVHVALLKLIIKDIEDVARTPSIGAGTNPGGGVNPEGGHPHIVEGAYAWGFSIRSWQRHLNPLTWPEILRQLALSAGFGPRLKKKSFKWAYLDDNIEGKGAEGVEDIVSTIRNGSAAENAVALMQERGFSLPRKSRHRLTPGTVKFAAFHVLSLEGSKGLMISELADKIQKSGLRDLTTSKTPEASIGVALSRDTKLFERIAPSTYRVRTAFRKDPADAGAILSAAREKLQVFENGFLAREDADGVEKDEDSECDVAEGPEMDVLSTPSDKNPEIDVLSTPSDKNKDIIYYDEESTLLDAKENVCNNTAVNLQSELQKDSSSFFSSSCRDVKNSSSGIDQYVPGVEMGSRISEQESTEIDESKSGELWVQGLAESEYFDTSVEERLNALVALIGVANEGNTIRAVLEDRLEAANALRKQMWAEAQLDKRRLKEEYITKFIHPSIGGKAETELTSSVAEGIQNPLAIVVFKENETSLSASPNVQNLLNVLPTSKTLVVQDFPMGPDNLLSEQNKYAAERSRAQLKSYIAHRAEEMYVYRSLPLGQDRRRNRYWQFVASASKNDPGSGRIFVELHDGHWRLIDTEEAFDALLMSLETRGIRESHLNLMLKNIETTFKENVRRKLQSSKIVSQSELAENEAVAFDYSPECTASVDSPGSVVCGVNSDTLELSSSFRIELGRNGTEKTAALKRYGDFQKWMWKECFNALTLCAIKFGKERCAPLFGNCDSCLDSYILEDNGCCSCLSTCGTSDNHLNLPEHAIRCEEKKMINLRHTRDSYSIPLGPRLLKALLALIEVRIPLEALHSFWTEDDRKTWGMKLHASSSIEDLQKILTLLEFTIKRDFLSSDFDTTQELLGSYTLSTIYDSLESVPELPWIPQTSAAVALRLLELDASIMYVQHQKAELRDDNIVPEFVKLPSRCDFASNKEVELTDMDLNNHVIENFTDPGSGRNSSKCGRGRGGRGRGRAHGERWQRRVSGPKSKSSSQTARDSHNRNTKYRRQDEQVSGWGRRIVRGRRTEKSTIKETPYDHFSNAVSPIGREDLPRYVGEEDDWEEFRMKQVEDADDSDSAEAVESDDNAQATRSEHASWGVSFRGASDGRMGYPRQVSDEEMDGSEDENDSEEDGDGNSYADVDMNEGSDGILNRTANEDEGFESAFSDDESD